MEVDDSSSTANSIDLSNFHFHGESVRVVQPKPLILTRLARKPDGKVPKAELYKDIHFHVRDELVREGLNMSAVIQCCICENQEIKCSYQVGGKLDIKHFIVHC